MGGSTTAMTDLPQRGYAKTDVHQHWLKQSPTEFLGRYVDNEWARSSSYYDLRKIRYYSFTLRTFVFRGDRLFLTNRNSNHSVPGELTVPTDRFDVILTSSPDIQPPMYQVDQETERSIGDHIRTVLSARHQHPNTLQNARFLDEYSFAEPVIRRRIEGSTFGEHESYLCNIELSVVMSKYDGSLGNGPAYRWVTEADIACLDGSAQLVSGMDAVLLGDMFSRYSQCRLNRCFQERCTEDIRSALRVRWKQNDIARPYRYGVIGQRDDVDSQGVCVFNMTIKEAAMRKYASEIYHDDVRYHIVGRFSIEAVQLSTEVEIWRQAVDDHGSVKIAWCEHSPPDAFLRLLPP
ncbi:hypothetical protein AC579_10556 [Pseudocercospora musae]|uniref:Uncharacterized protein n=1 Tax=Pseudocercospora musae TaxID=113226 RepID=A0A139I0M3_9PEZI|nr:hypothetical protein AC579_10556 [Pseudocercospora musae]